MRLWKRSRDQQIVVPGKVNIKWDDDAQALYVTLRVHRGMVTTTQTVCVSSPLVNIDWNGDQLLGIEVIP